MLWRCVGSEVVLGPAHSTALPLQSRSLGWNALGLWSCRSQGDERPLVESLVCQCAILCHLYPFGHCRVRKGKNDWSQSLRTSSSIKVRCDQVVLSIFNVRKLDHVSRSFPSIAQVTQSLQKFSVFAVFSCDESSGMGLRTTCETIVNIRSLALNTGKFQSWSTQ